MHLTLNFRCFYLSFQRICLLGLLSTHLLSSRSPAQAQSIPQPTATNLTVEITGLETLEGQVCVSLFPGSAGFPNDESNIVDKQCIEPLGTETTSVETEENAAMVEDTATSITQNTSDDTAIADTVLTVTFAEIPPGTYAVSVMHDENKDNDLNTGTFGIPVEGFGFSQNPSIGMGAPEFGEAAIVVFGRDTTTQIELVYF